MRHLTSTLALAAALIQGCASTPPSPAENTPQSEHRAMEVRSAAIACETWYGLALPEGATRAMPVPSLSVSPQPGGPRAAYACIMVTVNESGEATDGRMLETDDPAFGEYFIKLARRARYQPAMRDGKPFTQQVVVSAAYW
jgi:hypothetical protein